MIGDRCVNLTGYFHGFKAVLPHMTRRHHGAIVSIASVAGRFGAAGGAGYGAAKWGVIGLSKAVAREYGADNIRADVARSVAFLLSDDARYLSGVALDVAAGWNATWSA